MFGKVMEGLAAGVILLVMLAAIAIAMGFDGSIVNALLNGVLEVFVSLAIVALLVAFVVDLGLGILNE